MALTNHVFKFNSFNSVLIVKFSNRLTTDLPHPNPTERILKKILLSHFFDLKSGEICRYCKDRGDPPHVGWLGVAILFVFMCLGYV